MGCDIHVTYEVRRDGQWEPYDWEEKYYTGPVDADWYRPRDYDKLWNDPLHVGRNYDVFAILADVRNGHGFAGVKTSEGFNIISEPRGLPIDATELSKRKSDDYGRDGHSHSWLTLAELLAFDWSQSTKQQGYVDSENFKKFCDEGKPQGYCGAVSGGGVRHVSNQEMRDAIVAGDDLRGMYTLVKWNESYHSSCHWFVTKTLEAMKELGNPEDVRMVFFFDN